MVIIKPQKLCIFSNFGLDTKFGWRFFFSPLQIPKEKKPRKIGHQRGREEIVCDYREKIKPYPFALDTYTSFEGPRLTSPRRKRSKKSTAAVPRKGCGQKNQPRQCPAEPRPVIVSRGAVKIMLRGWRPPR